MIDATKARIANEGKTNPVDVILHNRTHYLFNKCHSRVSLEFWNDSDGAASSVEAKLVEVDTHPKNWPALSIED